jgi:hypothetical protein
MIAQDTRCRRIRPGATPAHSPPVRANGNSLRPILAPSLGEGQEHSRIDFPGNFGGDRAPLTLLHRVVAMVDVSIHQYLFSAVLDDQPRQPAPKNGAHLDADAEDGLGQADARAANINFLDALHQEAARAASPPAP